QAISTLAQHYGVMFFYRGREAIDGQLVQVIKNFRETYGLSVITTCSTATTTAR
ncbi:hypothetical protein CKQ79_28865, partial [Klebsiella pneumoniae]